MAVAAGPRAVREAELRKTGIAKRSLATRRK
jgi:hypothetical protein